MVDEVITYRTDRSTRDRYKITQHRSAPNRSSGHLFASCEYQEDANTIRRCLSLHDLLLNALVQCERAITMDLACFPEQPHKESALGLVREAIAAESSMKQEDLREEYQYFREYIAQDLPSTEASGSIPTFNEWLEEYRNG